MISSAEIADREIKIWKTHTVPFPKDKNPLDEWRRGVVYLFPWLGVLARRVLANFFFLILILIAFITGNSSLEPLIEGLCAQIHVNLR